jgi:hypothetical protein
MLRITATLREDEVVLKLEGCLAGPWAQELVECWRGVSTYGAGRRVRVDLTDVCHADAGGREVMRTMYRAGTRFTATGCVMPELVREIASDRGRS